MNTAGLRGTLHIRVKFANFFEKVKSLGEVSDHETSVRRAEHTTTFVSSNSLYAMNR